MCTFSASVCPFFSSVPSHSVLETACHEVLGPGVVLHRAVLDCLAALHKREKTCFDVV